MISFNHLQHLKPSIWHKHQSQHETGRIGSFKVLFNRSSSESVCLNVVIFPVCLTDFRILTLIPDLVEGTVCGEEIQKFGAGFPGRCPLNESSNPHGLPMIPHTTHPHNPLVSHNIP